jgi:hypothetical protein
MPMNIRGILNSQRSMKALTGLSREEFEALVLEFGKVLHAYLESRPNRQRKIGAGQKGHLPTIQDKLFFILFYVKTYPTFDVLSAFCGKSRGRCCTAVHLYLEILEKTLGHQVQLPEGKITSIQEFQKKFPDVKDVFVDGTERPIQKPKSQKRNGRHYSGKKKRHTRKNVVVTDENKRILMITPTKPGRRHDKNCADRSHLINTIPQDVGLWADSAFCGMQHLHKNTVISKRGRKNKPLTAEEKQENRVISSLRICVEHAIGGIKRYRATTDVLRNKIGRFDDRVIRVAAGLWNHHLLFN